MTEPGGESRVDQSISHETVQPPVTIRSYTPAELDDATIERLDLYNLIGQATNIPNEDNAKAFARELLQTDDPPTRVTYLAEAEGKAVGSLILNKVPAQDTDPLGAAFLSYFDNSDPEFANSMRESSDMIAAVHGAMTAPDWRGKGVQRKIWQKIIEEIDPTIVLGESKNPAAVMARVKALEPLGYETYFGFNGITSTGDNAPAPPIAKNIVDVAVALNGGRDGFIHAPNDIFAARTPDVSSFPPGIQRAFEGVITAQGQVGDRITVVQPLISVKNSLLDRPSKP